MNKVTQIYSDLGATTSEIREKMFEIFKEKRSKAHSLKKEAEKYVKEVKNKKLPLIQEKAESFNITFCKKIKEIKKKSQLDLSLQNEDFLETDYNKKSNEEFVATKEGREKAKSTISKAKKTNNEKTVKKSAEKVEKEIDQIKKNANIKIEEVSFLSKNIINSLKEQGIDNIEKLKKTSQEELLKVKGLGKGTLDKIKSL